MSNIHKIILLFSLIITVANCLTDNNNNNNQDDDQLTKEELIQHLENDTRLINSIIGDWQHKGFDDLTLKLIEFQQKFISIKNNVEILQVTDPDYQIQLSIYNKQRLEYEQRMENENLDGNRKIGHFNKLQLEQLYSQLKSKHLDYLKQLETKIKTIKDEKLAEIDPNILLAMNNNMKTDIVTIENLDKLYDEYI
ncbi:uncharacterized protein LOC128957160 [Oppia nitens]|uniref:uncharacterized protein LOC128957160 n=1 Tax=Oppia nitens TaxID=1686743 RepID=UPI0023DCD9EC|nr:uncharacterized protein LOC128957160 [Oppia nitens]